MLYIKFGLFLEISRLTEIPIPYTTPDHSHQFPHLILILYRITSLHTRITLHIQAIREGDFLPLLTTSLSPISPPVSPLSEQMPAPRSSPSVRPTPAPHGTWFAAAARTALLRAVPLRRQKHTGCMDWSAVPGGRWSPGVCS